MPKTLSPSAPQLAMYAIGVALIVAAAAWQFSRPASQPGTEVSAAPLAAAATSAPSRTPLEPPSGQGMASGPTIISQGGAGGSATAGAGGVAIGGPGGHSGGLPGKGGDGGGGGIGEFVAGGGGGSVDGTDIWFPPAASGYEVMMRAKGQMPDPDMKQYGRGGMSPGYASRFTVVEAIRKQYFARHGLEYRSVDQDIHAMPLHLLNAELSAAGHSWIAREDQGYYVFYIPKSPS